MTSRPKAPALPSKPAARAAKAKPAAKKATGKTTLQRYNAVVSRSAKSGIYIAEPVEAGKNPYLLPEKEAKKVMRKAGIITPTGKLARVFR